MAYKLTSDEPTDSDKCSDVDHVEDMFQLSDSKPELSTAFGPISPKSSSSRFGSINVDKTTGPAGPTGLTGPTERQTAHMADHERRKSLEKSQIMLKAQSYSTRTHDIDSNYQIVGIPCYSVNYFPAYKKRFNF